MRTALITGFEPFGGEDCNPSWDAVKRFTPQFECTEQQDQTAIARGPAVRTLCLPVEFGRAFEQLRADIAKLQPDLVIAIGQAGGRNALNLERVALNWIDARIPDNAGLKPEPGKILPQAPAAYLSNYPITAALRLLREAHIPAEGSLSAGAFVCNELYFRLCQLQATEFPFMQVLFLHVPYAPEQVCKRNIGHPSMGIDQVEAAIQILLRTDRAQAPGATAI